MTGEQRSCLTDATEAYELIHANANISGVIGFAAFGIRIVVIDDGADPPVGLSANQIGWDDQEGIECGVGKAAV